MRHEIKFNVRRDEGLGKFFLLSRYNFRPAYSCRTVNSIYFDNFQYCNFFDNIEGFMEREKLRIRWYGSKKTEYNNFQIQIKSKNNLVGFKDILRISDDDYDELDCKQIYSQIANIHNIDRNISGKFLARLLNQIKIVKIVYSRDYYYSDQLNCRLTVDTQICAYPMQKVLRSRVRKYSFSNKIVELKYDVAEIESVSNYLSEIRVTNVGFSKYTQGVAGLIQKVVL